MDWFETHCDRLRLKLQNVIDRGASYSKELGVRKGIRVPWSWTCRAIIEAVSRYPSGLTEAIILAELELLWRKDVRGAFVPGKLRAYLDAQHAPLSDVIQAAIVRHSDQLVTIAEDHSGSVAAVGHSPTTAGMYLHQNFKSCLHFLQQAGHDLLAPGRRVRLTGCRMLMGTTINAGYGVGVRTSHDASGSTLLLTEYLAFVLDHRRSDDVKLAAGAFGSTRVRETFSEVSNEQPLFVLCKVVEIRRPRQYHQDRAAGPAQKKRLAVQTIVLECAVTGKRSRGERGAGGSEAAEGGAGDGREETTVVLLHLWDEQMCLSSLFASGDGLVIYWPWVVEEGGEGMVKSSLGGSQQLSALHSQGFSCESVTRRLAGWHYEYGSATALFVLPRDSRGPLFAAANGCGALDSSTAVTAARVNPREALRDTVTEIMRASEMPVDENGVRDLLQYPRRLSVADLCPNMSNASVYGQVVSVGVPNAPLPAILVARRGTAGASLGFLSQPQSKQLLQQPMNCAEGITVVEVVIRDAGGEARVLCFGREATADALGCRPGHFVLACGLRTLTPAFPPLESQPGDSIVIVCGELEDFQQVSKTSAGDGSPGRRGGARGGIGRGGISRILNVSRLEGLLHCPFMSRNVLLHSQKKCGKEPVATFACKVAVTWAQWAFAGDGLWVVHRLCRARLPCHYGDLDSSSRDSTKRKGSKRARDTREPGGMRAPGAQEVLVTCPLCKTRVRLACVEEVELAYAPLLLALDDGSRCIVAECLDEVVPAALGGINANVFLQLGDAERRATLTALIGRELRCVVGGNGSVAERDNAEGGGVSGGNGTYCWSGAEYRVERIALANPAADLAHLLWS